jgi:hypothetical protein
LLIDETQPTLYKIAFPLAGIFGSAIIMSIVHPASRFAPILENKVLLWIGERSYAIYLWHWVIFQVTRPTVDLAGQTWALYSLRILIVFALADISLRFVELPIRRGVIQYWWKGRKYRTKQDRNIQTYFFASLTSLVFLLAAWVSVRALIISEEARIDLQESLTAVQSSNAQSTPTGVWLTGDSVILGIRAALEENRPLSVVNARIGRQAPELLSVIQHDKAQAAQAPIVFNLGNNNALTKVQVEEIFQTIKDQPEIVVVNTAVPRPWRDANNKLIREVAYQYPKVKIVDWNSISNGHPEYFAPDGVHLVPTGVKVYVAAILTKLRAQ